MGTCCKCPSFHILTVSTPPVGRSPTFSDLPSLSERREQATGGEATAIKKDKFHDYMRLCFCTVLRRLEGVGLFSLFLSALFCWSQLLLHSVGAYLMKEGQPNATSVYRTQGPRQRFVLRKTRRTYAVRLTP